MHELVYSFLFFLRLFLTKLLSISLYLSLLFLHPPICFHIFFLSNKFTLLFKFEFCTEFLKLFLCYNFEDFDIF